MKRIISLMLSLVMVLALVPFSVSAATDYTYSQGVKYTLSGNSSYYIVSDCGEYYATSVTIPDKINGLPVKKIAEEAFWGCDSLTSVVIGNSVTTIGNSAFEYCSKLTSVEMGNSVTTIGEYAFSKCFKLTSIEISNSVTTIGNYAFEYCSKLTSVKIGNAVTTIGTYAFFACYSLTSVEIGNSVTTICNYAFDGCSSLTSIEIPNSVTTIGSYAFSDCSKLTSVEMGNSVTTIGRYAFSDCYSLTSVEMGNSVTNIYECAFYKCSKLTSIEIPDSVTTICYSAFCACDSLTSIEIPNSVTTIWQRAFEYCDSLTDIYCEAESQPEGWNDYWKDGCNATVHWGVHLCNGEGGWISDGTSHWKLCSCGEKVDVAEHTPGAEADCENDQICTICEHVLVEAYGHKAEGDWKYDEEMHWKSCSCGEDVDVDSHDFEWIITSEPEVGVPGEKEYTCKTCGYVSETEPLPAKPENLVLGMDDGVTGYGNYTADLTDGKAHKELTYDNNWFAFYYHVNYPSQVNAPNRVGTVTFDLGAYYDLSEIKVNTYVGGLSGILPPSKIEAFYAISEGEYISLGELAYIDNGSDVQWGSIDAAETRARFVKIEVTLNGTFAFINEIEVYGEEPSGDTPSEPSHECKGEGDWQYDEEIHWKSCHCGKDTDAEFHDYEWVVTLEPQVGVPGEKEYTCKTCGYVSETEEIPALEPEILLGDVNGNGTLDTMDYSLLKRVYFGIYNTSNLDAGDINGNGGLDTMDYSLLKRVYFGIYII